MRTITALALACLLGATMARADELPDFDRMWDYDKPEETEKRFRELLPKAQAAGNLDYELQLRTQIARTFGLRGLFDEAHAELDAVEKRLTEDVPVAHVCYLLERGRAFNSSKKVDRAMPLFLEAYERAKKAKSDVLALDAAHMMAIVEQGEKQLEWNYKALEIAETSKDKRAKGWLGPLYNNIGWALFDLGRYEEALEVHEKGVAWREKVGAPSLIARWSVARMLRALKRYDEALAAQEKLLAEREKLGEPDGFVHEELGELYLVKGREDEAKAQFAKAWALLKDVKWLKSEDPERYARIRKMAGAEEEVTPDSD